MLFICSCGKHRMYLPEHKSGETSPALVMISVYPNDIMELHYRVFKKTNCTCGMMDIKDSFVIIKPQ